MIDCGLFQYAGPPRTGSTWVMHSLHACGLPCGSKAHIHWPHLPKADKPRVSTIRHPGRWLPSFFSQIGRGALQDNPAFDEWQGLDETTFDNFCRSYLDRCPGAVGRMFDRYGADVHLRIEDAPECLASFLESLGLSGAGCRTIQRNNAGRRLPIWSPALFDRVMRAESDFLDRFEYGAYRL